MPRRNRSVAIHGAANSSTRQTDHKPTRSIDPPSLANAENTQANRLSVLLVDYQISRDDDRSAYSSLGAVASIGVALLAGLATVVGGDCRFRADQTQCFNLPNSVLTLMPILPLIIITFAIMMSEIATTRSFYMRSLEAELRASIRTGLASSPEVLVPSGIELTLGVISPSRGRNAYRAMLTITVGGCILTFMILTAIILASVPLYWSLTFGPIYLATLLFLARESLVSNTGGRALFQHGVKQMMKGSYPKVEVTARARTRVPPGHRSILSYVILPRPQEIVKFLFVPIAFAIGSLLQNRISDSPSIGLLSIAWLSFEYLCYQARYQWNDIRGLAGDLRHPSSKERGRLPTSQFGTKASVLISSAVAMLRIAAFGLICAWLPMSTGSVLGICAISAWLLAVLYEIARTKQPASSITRSSTVWLLSGGGYGIRVALGLALAGLSPTSLEFSLLIAATWCIGIQFVTAGWTLEAYGHCWFDQHGKVSYASSETHPSHTLKNKPHLRMLLPLANIAASEIAQPESLKKQCDKERPLAKRTRLAAPWNLGTLLAVTLTTTAVLHKTGASQTAAVVIVGLAGTISTSLASTRTRRYTLAGSTVAAQLLIVSLVASPLLPIAASFTLPIIIYAYFTASSYAELRDAPAKISKRLANVASRITLVVCEIARFIIGADTWTLLTRRQ